MTGRASATPSIDLFITLLSLGSAGYQQLLQQRKVRLHGKDARKIKYSQTPHNRHPVNMDTSLLRIVCFDPVERRPLHFFKFNLLNTDTSLIWTPSMIPSVSTLIRFDSTDICSSVVFHII